MKTRILTALLLLLIFLSALFLLPAFYWSLAVSILLALGAWEWGRLVLPTNRFAALYTVLTLLLGPVIHYLVGQEALAAFISRYNYSSAFLLAAAGLWLIVVPSILAFKWNVRNIALLSVIGWVVLIPTWLALLHLRAGHVPLLLGVLVAIWIADSAAYFVGRKFGKHKLAPAISPGKTWEGVGGALVAVTLYGLGLCLFLDLPMTIILALWAITIVSITGDLFESWIKRQAGVKDSGTLFPGHGGVLDRIDALTSTLPLVALYLLYLQSR